MLSAIAWLILMLLLVIVPPIAGLGLGLLLGGGVFALQEAGPQARCGPVRPEGGAEDAFGATTSRDPPLPASIVVPQRLGGSPVPPGRIALATELRARRCRLFLVEACDEQGRRRVLKVDALNLAAAEKKVWKWGLQVRRVDALTTDSYL